MCIRDRVKEYPVQHEVGEQRGAAGEASDGKGVDVLLRVTHNPVKSLTQATSMRETATSQTRVKCCHSSYG
eukprot:1699609-Pyramimonas_sp.AAC.1